MSNKLDISRLVLFALLLLVIRIDGVAQPEPISFKNKVSLTLKFWGPEILGAEVYYGLNNRLAVQAAVGINTTLHAGVSYYFMERIPGKLNSSAGIVLVSYKEFELFDSNSANRQAGLYIPIGIAWEAKKGFLIRLEAGPNILQKDWGQINTLPVLVSLNIGYTLP